MKSSGAWMALLMVCGLSARAFVVELNDNGDPLRWHLNPLEPPVPPNPPDQGVHTNVVNPVTKAIRYFLASDAYSTANAPVELNAVRASFAQWQSVPGTLLKFEEGGLVAPGVDINTSDNQNVVFWAKNSTLVNGGLDDISGTLAVTFNSFFPDDNAQAEADIVFNGVQYSWSADFNSADTTQYFIESTATHEIGHFIGLKHSPAGGATMLFHGAGGVNVQAGLSTDEVAAAQWLYGQPSTLAALGRLQGQVTLNGSGMFGAAVVVEEFASGNLIEGTITRTNGDYDLPALLPGKYNVRVTPLDPVNASFHLIRGRDINSERDTAGNYVYDSVVTGFLPATNVAVTLTAGSTLALNFAVASGSPAFRITQIRAPNADPGSFNWSPFPATMRPGQSNYTIGVASADLPASGATLTLAGDGLTLGTPDFQSLAGLNFISVSLSVASNATAGLRSFLVQRGSDVAYANGFLEIQPTVPDFNFDGLDDRFQRQYFPLFTAPEAAPDADPDGDTFNNHSEYIAGTNPTNSLSLLKIDSVVLNTNGSTLAWESVPGKRYQVFGRLDLDNAPWQAVGAPVTAAGATTAFTDATATNGFRFYRVQALP